LLPLSQRHPVATIGREPRGKKDRDKDDGDGGDGGGFTGGGADAEDMRSIKRHADETFDHKPNELYVAVNGYTLGSQRINSKRNDLTLDVNVTEPIDFIEVFSEQQVRLLFACVEDPPAGPIKQPVSIALSDGRRLEATLKFRSPWPTLHVVYSDPQFTEVDEAFIASYQQHPDAPLPMAPVSTPVRAAGVSLIEVPQHALAAITNSARKLVAPRFWLRPATVTAIFALLLISAVVWLSRSVMTPALTVASLLQRSATAEEAAAAQTDTVLHRTINFEEKSATGGLIARRKIEVWQSAERGITARRLYDERGQLIAGDWRRSDGVQTLYHHGTQPQLQIRNPESAIRSFDNAWQLSPSAKEFALLIAESESKIQQTPAGYVISYERHGTTNDGLVQATLTLSRADLHATEQTLLIQQGTELREYSFVEATFERHRPATVAPSVFEPEPVLLGTDTGTRRNGDAENIAAAPSVPVSASPVVATAALEIEVLRLLNQVGADTGEQISVRRTPAGLLQVDAVVDTEARKREILRALEPVRYSPAMRIEVETVGERVAREIKSRPSSGAVTVERIEPASNSIPLEPELQRYFAARGVASNKIDEEVQRFSRQALSHSSQALQHAGALRSLAARFSPEELRTLDPESRARWLALINQHAQSLKQNSSALRLELRAIVAAPAADSTDVSNISNDAELLQAVNRLFAMCSANDATVRSALSLSNDSSKAAAVKGAQFWRSLANVEALATKISKQ